MRRNGGSRARDGLRSREMLRGAVSVVLSCIAVGCAGACGGTNARGGSGGDVPAAVAELAGEEYEIQPFTGWSIAGVKLYQLTSSDDDRSETAIVGVDESTGALVRGAELMRRLPPLDPPELARRASTILLSGSSSGALLPTDPHDHLPEAEWAAVAAPTVENDTLVFFTTQGEMSPRLVEHRISLDTFAVTTRPAIDVLLERGETVPLDPPTCEPLQRCGCWSGCGRFQRVRLPGRPPTPRTWRLEGTEAAEIFVREPNCVETAGAERCARVCPADTPTARCEDALKLEAGETCTGVCVPSEAPFHCDLTADGCTEVPHPGRGAADP